MEWYSWTSPLGLGLFIISISFAFFVLSASIYILIKSGEKGKKMENRVGGSAQD